jgi:hypothetical protein
MPEKVNAMMAMATTTKTVTMAAVVLKEQDKYMIFSGAALGRGACCCDFAVHRDFFGFLVLLRVCWLVYPLAWSVKLTRHQSRGHPPPKSRSPKIIAIQSNSIRLTRESMDDFISQQPWTYQQPPAPTVNGGWYTGEQFPQNAPWRSFPVTPDVSALIGQNLLSARPPPGATQQFPGSYRPGNNAQAMPGVVPYPGASNAVMCTTRRDCPKVQGQGQHQDQDDECSQVIPQGDSVGSSFFFGSSSYAFLSDVL